MKKTLDFIVIGAQKAGTTSLFEYLKRHPELYLPPRKETPYFSHDLTVSRGWNQYLRDNFTMADPASKWGTITTHYMGGGVWDASAETVSERRYDIYTVPRRIQTCLPDVRLIAILRDPVERAYSHYKMMLMNGLERRPFDQVVDELLGQGMLASSREYPQETTSYITRGEYGRILGGYFEVFSRDQILILFQDELEAAPEDVLAQTQKFIGVDAGFTPENLGTRYREGGITRRVSALKPDALVRGIARRSVPRRIWHTLPEGRRLQISHGYAGLAYKIDLWNRDTRTSLDPPKPATLVRLREHFESDAEQLSVMLDVSPPWRTESAK